LTQHQSCDQSANSLPGHRRHRRQRAMDRRWSAKDGERADEWFALLPRVSKPMRQRQYP
jgi:hypothetical protein